MENEYICVERRRGDCGESGDAGCWLRVPRTSLRRVILHERVCVWRVFCMETSASSGRTKRLFHRKSIATIYATEHVLNVANSYLAYWWRRVLFLNVKGGRNSISCTYIHTYHSHFIPEGVAEVSQIFLRDAHVLPKLIIVKIFYIDGLFYDSVSVGVYYLSRLDYIFS
jgi:hypothetical protein